MHNIRSQASREHGHREQAKQHRGAEFVTLALAADVAAVDVPVDPLADQRRQLPVPAIQDLLVCQAPKGNWKVMAFYLTGGKARVVDYLDETAMSTFISMTYQKYQDNFGSYFGNLIKQTFYDEPSMHHAD